MNTSQTSLLSEITNGESIPVGKLAYFRERQKNRLYDFIVSKFLEKEKNSGLTKAEIARRLDKRPEQVTRWLATPGNCTQDTMSDLMLAICNSELIFEAAALANARRNYFHPSLDDTRVPPLRVSTSTNTYTASPIIEIERPHA